MTSRLLKKEFVLAMHPTVPLFLAMAAMVLIPNYPFTVIFFYMTLGIFFTCLQGRENNDVFYSVSLPVEKRDIVKARLLFACIVETAQIVLVSFFAMFRSQAANAAGLDANPALYGFAFILFGLFNIVFFPAYYANLQKVGITFIKATTIYFIASCLIEASAFVVPFVKNELDSVSSSALPYQLAVLASGILLFALLSFAAYRLSAKRLSEHDIQP